MDQSSPAESDRRVSPGRCAERVAAGRVPGASVRGMLHVAAAIAGVLSLTSLACPRDRSAIPANLPGDHPGMILAIAVSPDGRWLASSGFEGSVRIRRLRDQAIEATLEVERGPAYSLAWSPDGSALAAAAIDGIVSVWDARSWERSRALPHAGRVRGLAWSSDGSLLAAGGPASEITIWDTASWQPRATLRGHHATANLLTFSSDGRSLISAGADGRIGIWDLATARPIRFLLAGPQPLCGLACTPDGEILSACQFGRGTFRCRLNEAGDETRILQDGGPYLALTSSADGRLLAASTGRGAVDLWDLPARRQIATLDDHSGPVWAMAFTPDGRAFFSGGFEGTIRTWRARREGDGDGPIAWLSANAQDAAATTPASPP